MMLWPKPKQAKKVRAVATIGGIGTTFEALREFVFRRDRACLGWRFDPSHECRDQWGMPHRPDDRSKLTLGHVPMVHSITDPRRDDEAHCVAECWSTNAGVHPSAELREFERGWLHSEYPDHVD